MDDYTVHNSVEHLTELVTGETKRAVMLALADLAEVEPSDVQDLDGGRPESVSASVGEDASGQKFLSVRALITASEPADEEQRDADPADGVVAAVTSSYARQRLADSLRSTGQIRFHEPKVTARKQQDSGFLARDADQDGLLDRAEFLSAATDFFRPPLSEEEAAAAAKLLDRDGDGRLSLEEFMAGKAQKQPADAAG